MRSLKILSLAIITTCISFAVTAQEQSETFKVPGKCGMCKSKIEKSAKEAGASYALWDTKTKELTVKFNSEATNAVRIQQFIAKAGYDTPGVKATNESYKKLSACCKYDRKGENEGKTAGEECDMKDGEKAGCCSHESEHEAKTDKTNKEKAKCSGKSCCKKS